MLKNEALTLTRVVVCKPETEFYINTNKSKHNIKQVADKEKALLQHGLLVETMLTFGTEVFYISELKGHPNSVFTKDTTTVTPEGYIHLRMGLPTRVKEDLWMSEFLSNQGEPCIGIIKSPGTVEGGDVILAGKTAFVGISSRTNEAGALQISEIFNNLNIKTRLCKIPSPYLHLGGAMTLIGTNHVLCCKNVFPPSFFDGFKISEIESGDFISGNVILLGNNDVIVEKRNTHAINVLESEKFNVHPLNLSEFVKGNGGPSCLIMPIERKVIN
jgi:dimethylargininase